MASIALHLTRTSFPVFRSSWARPAFSAALLPTLLASQKSLNWAIPSLQSLLELLPPFLLAVPKKKVSHSQKAMRSSNKGLKDKRNIVSCPACGQPKLAYHLCSGCYSSFARRWKMYGDTEEVQMMQIGQPAEKNFDQLNAPEAPTTAKMSGRDRSR